MLPGIGPSPSTPPPPRAPVRGGPSAPDPAVPWDRLEVDASGRVAAPRPAGPAGVASASEPPDSWARTWSPQVIYFPLTDRFEDGDPTNNYEVDRGSPKAFHGGDLRGLIQRLDYIQGLGATTLWLPPVTDSTNHARIGEYEGTGYHGYWVRDHYRVEEHQGTLETLKELVGEAHRRGMKVVLDVVLNHVGPDHPWVRDPQKAGWFHAHGPIRDWEDPRELEDGEVGGLPDLAQENPEVYRELLASTLWWVEQTGVDGLRLDAVKHVPKAFWERLTADLRAARGPDFLLLGEVLHGDPKVQAPYQRAGVEALFDIPLYYTIKEVFAEGGSAELLGRRLDEDRSYLAPHKLVTLLDNHDFPRFMTSAGGHRDRLKLALAFLMTVRGIPSIYYGTEVGMQGGHDPDNRRGMEWGADPDMTDHVRRLTSLRASQPPLQLGHQQELWRDREVYAFARRFEGQEVVAIFNNSPAPQRRVVSLGAGSCLGEGALVEDALSGERFRVRAGALEVELPGRQARVLVHVGG